MKESSNTYRAITKATATLLLLAFLIPTGLQAGQIVDFCMMEMSTHPTCEASNHTGMMANDHSCCESAPIEENNTDHTHQDCDWGFICACSAGQNHLGDTEWIPTTKNLETTLTQQGDILPFFTSSEQIQADQQIRIGEYDPPLWLLYDTFLM